MSMKLNEGDKKLFERGKQETIATHKFVTKYLERRNSGEQRSTAFDSAVHVNESDEKDMPESLQFIMDNIGAPHKAKVLGALEGGINLYKKRNGGEMPPAHVLAAAFGEGAALLDGFINKKPGFDSLSYSHHESNSVVASQVIVAISMRIASSIPIISYLPNPKGSNEVPLVYARHKANKTFNAFKKDEYLDGPKASLPYIDNVFEFVMSKVGNTNEYTLTPRVAYADYFAKTPDTATQAAPFLGGRVQILVNGVEVANDYGPNHPTKSGTSNLQPLGSFTIDATSVKVQAATASLDTHLISATFNAALPAGAKVTARIVLDYERKDENDRPIITPPGVDIDIAKQSIFAYPIRAKVTATIDAITQMQNELGLDAVGSGIAVLYSKWELEKNTRLLREGIDRAKGLGRVYVMDLSRGSDYTSGFNSTSDIASELLLKIKVAELGVNNVTGNSPSGFDIYVGDVGAMLFMSLKDDVGWSATGATIGANDAITRIGSLKTGENVYHVPEGAELFNEANQASQILVVARNSDPAKNLFVGHTAVPLITEEIKELAFEKGVGVYARQAAQLNPLERFADQIAVIDITDAPLSVTKS